MYIMGLDPGLKGGIFLLGENNQDKIWLIMPTIGNELDILVIYEFFKKTKPKHAYLEKVSAMPKQGVVSMFNFGQSYGILKALLVACKIPYTLVTSQKWQKEMHQGISKKLKPKERSLMAVKQLFPDIDLRPTERCKNLHDGLVDALLIADYGKRHHYQKN